MKSLQDYRDKTSFNDNQNLFNDTIDPLNIFRTLAPFT